MKQKNIIVWAGVILAVLMAVESVSAHTMSSGMLSAREAICNILYNIRMLLYSIASGVAVVSITLQGIKWIGSSEDAGVRKQAREGIIHAIVGLIIVLTSVWIVLLVFTGSQCAI